jgi:hypothetical protein
LDIEGENGLINRVTWSQFLAWIEYHQVDPFGSERGDMQAALIASVADNVSRTLINVNLDHSKASPLKPANIADFVLDFSGAGVKRNGGGRSGSDSGGTSGRRRIMSADAWARTVNQVRGIAEINAATRRHQDRTTGETWYE